MNTDTLINTAIDYIVQRKPVPLDVIALLLAGGIDFNALVNAYEDNKSMNYRETVNDPTFSGTIEWTDPDGYEWALSEYRSEVVRYGDFELANMTTGGSMDIPRVAVDQLILAFDLATSDADDEDLVDG